MRSSRGRKSQLVRTSEEDEAHGQPARAREDPYFTSPIFFNIGLILIALAILILFFVVIDLVLVRFRIRSGRWGVRPTSKDEIVKLLTGASPPGVAGQGFGYWYGFRRASGKVVTFGGNWAGLVKEVSTGVYRVRSGTLMGELTRIVDEQGHGKLALFDRAQFDQLSVGGCLRAGAHGWAKEAWFVESVQVSALLCVRARERRWDGRWASVLQAGRAGVGRGLLVWRTPRQPHPVSRPTTPAPCPCALTRQLCPRCAPVSGGGGGGARLGQAPRGAQG
jgi:hypothetical protein